MEDVEVLIPSLDFELSVDVGAIDSVASEFGKG
jgi:hypothetical protein